MESYIECISRKMAIIDDELAESGIVPHVTNRNFIVNIFYEMERRNKMMEIDPEYRRLAVRFHYWESLSNNLN